MWRCPLYQQERGRLFIGHRAEVYEWMLVGILTRCNNLCVDPLKAKEPTTVRGPQIAGAGGPFTSLLGAARLRSAGGGSSRAGFGGFGRS